MKCFNRSSAFIASFSQLVLLFQMPTLNPFGDISNFDDVSHSLVQNEIFHSLSDTYLIVLLRLIQVQGRKYSKLWQ